MRANNDLTAALTRVQAAAPPLPWDYDTGTIYAAGDLSGIASTQSDQVGALLVGAVNALPALLAVVRAAQTAAAAARRHETFVVALREALALLEQEDGEEDAVCALGRAYAAALPLVPAAAPAPERAHTEVQA